MGSMNWLGFSLCPQELPSQGSNHGRLSAGSEECYDLGSDSTVPSSFGILEAFHRSSDNQSQDWNMKENSEISMLMGNQEGDDEQPKLENFLGSSHSFKENNNNSHNHSQNNGVYMLLNDYNNINNHTHNNNSNNNNNGMENPSSANNGLNVSMIKTWLSTNNNPSQQEMVIMSEDTNKKNGANGGGSGGTQSLSLSMGTGPHSGVTALPLLGTGGDGDNGADMNSSLCKNSNSNQQSDIISNNNTNNSSTTNLDTQSGALESVPRKSIETFGQRTSIYRGVTRHRWTGRYEAHLWDNSCRREGQTRKGRQVYLGGYDKEEKAARAYDLAAIKYWGTTTTTNFPISDYEKEVEDMQHMTRQEYVASLRRKSSGFSRGASIYRGVTRHHQHGRWQARIGRVAGNKDLYLGTFSTQEEAAEAYDIAAIKFRGLNAVTNFEINRYDVKSILESTNLPIGGAAKRLKEAEEFNSTDSNNNTQILRPAAITATEIGIPNYGSWPGIAFHQTQQAHPVTMQYHPYGNNTGQLQERFWCKQEQDPDSIGSNHYSDLTQQVQMGHGTHNFFQMDNLMGSGSDSNGYGLPYGNSNENYYSYVSEHANNNNSNSNSNSSNGVVRGTVGYYDQGSPCTNLVPMAIPTIASRTANMAVVGGPTGGVPPFTMWNNT